MESEAEAVKARVIVMPETLTVADRTFLRKHLQTWCGWATVESCVKRLKTPLTAFEFDAIATVAETESAKRGFQEFKQACEQAGAGQTFCAYTMATAKSTFGE